MQKWLIKKFELETNNEKKTYLSWNLASLLDINNYEFVFFLRDSDV